MTKEEYKKQQLEGEIDVEDEGVEDEDVPVNYEIAAYPSDYTLSGLAQMWKDGDIVIPDYQREFVWNIRQSSLLIESFLSGLPVPQVFFYINDENQSIVIDGQQRILSVIFFMEGLFGRENTQGKRQVFRLTGLGKEHPLNGFRFEDLDGSQQRKLKQAVLRAVNIRQLHPKGESTSAYHIFERLNTGGTPLKPQEIRNCVFRGEFNNLLRQANTDENWRKLLGKSYVDKHQKDVELLLRVFSLVDDVDQYEKPMKEFLNVSMGKNRSGTTPKAKQFFAVFPEVTKAIIEQIGEKPFHLRGPINISALDSILCVLIANHDQISSIDLRKCYDTIVKDSDFDAFTSINTTDPKTVVDRMEVVEKHFFGS